MIFQKGCQICVMFYIPIHILSQYFTIIDAHEHFFLTIKNCTTFEALGRYVIL
jgi:hypothetical protein